MLARPNVLGCVVVATLLLASSACDGGGAPPGDGGTPIDTDGAVVADGGVSPDALLSISGTVVDFVTGAPVDGAASIAALGVRPAPTVSTTGASFRVDGIPLYSSLHLLAASAPNHRNTYGLPIEIEAGSLEGHEAPAVSEAFLASAATAFGVTPAPGTGIVIAQAVRDDGSPYDGVTADAFAITGARGPYFLGDDLSPEPARAETSASAWVVFFDVAVGTATIAAAPGSTYVTTGVGPTSANAVSLVRATVLGEPPPVVENVSFARDVVPIFENRGCVACHSGSGIGRDEGGLTLSGSASLIHRELTEERSPNVGVLRTDVLEPEQSLVLTRPSLEDPPDVHPNVSFLNAYDPDYQILLAWIREGVLAN